MDSLCSLNLYCKTEIFVLEKRCLHFSLAYLDKNLPDGGISSTEDWQSLIAYRNSLLQGESEVHPVTLKQASARRYGKRKQMPDGNLFNVCIKLVSLSSFMEFILRILIFRIKRCIYILCLSL